MIISIVTICYNNIQGLKKTVESVIYQDSLEKIEYIIIDGASTDGTVEYLKTLPRSVKWISEKDHGISDAFNKGLKMASGEAILMLNSGDYFINNSVIKEVINDWKENTVDLLSYKVIVDDKTTLPQVDDPLNMWKYCDLPHQGTFVSKKVYNEIGGYSEEYRIRMDFHFFARCKSKGFSFSYNPKPITHYEPGGVSMKKENRIIFWTEGMAVKLKYGIPVTLKDFVKFILYLIK